MNAIILAGGKGSRMPDKTPKPLVTIRDKSILAWQLHFLLRYKEISKIIVSLGYRADEISDFIKVNYKNKPVEIVIEESPRGTAGGLKLAIKKSTDQKLLVINCDDITDTDIGKLDKLNENTICVAHPSLPFGLVREVDGYAQFEEKPTLTEWVSYGWYLLMKDSIESILPDEGMLEYDVFPKMKLHLHKHDGFWQPLNTRKDVDLFETRSLPDSLA